MPSFLKIFIRASPSTKKGNLFKVQMDAQVALIPTSLLFNEDGFFLKKAYDFTKFYPFSLQSIGIGEHKSKLRVRAKAMRLQK